MPPVKGFLLEWPIVVTLLQQEYCEMANPLFGELFKRLRIESGQTLRAFCLNHDFDPGNISKIERGRLAPPKSQEKLAVYAEALGLKKGSSQWQELLDLAAAEQGRIPSDLLDDELVGKLPIFFRALREINGADDEELRELAEKLRRA